MNAAHNTAVEPNIVAAVADIKHTQEVSRGRKVRSEDITAWMQAEQELAEVDFLRHGIKSHQRAYAGEFAD